ncbi:MAG: hypothetical protein A2X61_04010 [Ignavibacteria bacterium GWB2_35_12]|nr:MAG: hypothetical protein A2X63_00470 [Ignavibacteria bacterium GWA2_35_8]OGU40062.1 MAG: hypothetical protein A2X61_04010 [Ignavibacteria bacterium GWB2_35_12]OGU94005.1 MAG: hypothetical protein A2220_04620 [Ignavibacteria bacterium RIFOXYA2_FULL_35_10]OGV22862.1 MAG: hypothetical protein A2475_02460 [Ignavibacteria bacterium RIFOXYC2_FULL_35_21]
MRKNNKNNVKFVTKDEAIKNEIKQLISKIEPGSEVYLFGSRARGTNKRNSDWDLLILLDGKVDWPRKERLNNELYEIELNKGIIFNTIIRNKDFWQKDKLIRQTPFHINVQQERVAL